MVEPIRGHEVLQILVDGGGAMPREGLRAAAAARFGASAVFGNCHGDTFDFDGLIRFLGSKGKLHVEGDVVSLGLVPACGH